jgi:exosome complex RNA-binding protein Csl4
MKFKQYLIEIKKGSYLDIKRLPKEGDKVYAVVGFNQKIIQGTIVDITNIDRKGFANIYVEVEDKNSKKYHLAINQIFDHKPKKETIKDEYGETKVWR